MTKHNSGVMAGLVPAIYESDQPVVKVIPFGICREDQAHLPSARPVFHVPLAPDRRGDIRVRLGIDKPLQTVSFRKPLDQTLAMLPGAVPDIGGNASVERAVRPVRHYIDPGIFHLGLPSWMAGITPGHDGNELEIAVDGAARLKIGEHV